MTDKPYLFIGDRPNQRGDMMELIQEIEARGFAGVMSRSQGDNVMLSLAALDRTERITVATGISNIYVRHPSSMAAAASLIEELHPGRFILGIGVSHQPTHDRLGVSAGRPLEDMRKYVATLRDTSAGLPFPPLMLAALRKRMTRLAGEIADGVMWANGVRSHLPESLGEVRDRPPDFIVANVAPAMVSDDRRAALSVMRRALLIYMRLTNYQNYFIEAGFEEEMTAARAAIERGDEAGVLAAISERVIDDICVIGSPRQIRETVDAWKDAGLTHLALDCHSADGLGRGHREVLAAFD